MHRIALALVALATTLPTLAGNAMAAPAEPTIVVEGEATAEVVPDIAILSLGVALQRPRAPEVADADAKAVARVVASLTQMGIKPEDIRTTAVELSPVTDEPKTGAPKVVAYRAVTQLRVKVQPVDRAGPVQAKLIDDGVNTIDGVSFAIGGEAALRDRLKGDAARDARRQAELYAAALGVTLGRVLDIRPDRVGGRPNIVAAPASVVSRMAAEPMPIEAGHETVTERVSVTFALVEGEPGKAPSSK